MGVTTISTYAEAWEALRNANLAQALYDEGKVIMEGTLLVLHGEDHRARRNLEFRVFRRDFFRYYETQVFPRTLAETIASDLKAGRTDLVQFGHRVTVNLTADFAGVDRPDKSEEETAILLRLVKTFSEGATLVHSTRDKEAVRREVREGLAEFDKRFLQPSIARRQALIARVDRGEIPETELPRDVLTELLRNESRLSLPPDLVRREVAFYLQAGAHSTANSTTHAMHEIFEFCRADPREWQHLADDPLFLQRCVHESLRLHPASPVAWRKPVCPMQLLGKDVADGDQIVINLFDANRDRSVFGADADVFNPRRSLPTGTFPFGLTFGIGVHTCLGRDLDGGVVPKGDVDPKTHQYGIVAMLARELLRYGARPDPDDPPQPALDTSRPNWGRYPIRFQTPGGAS